MRREHCYYVNSDVTFITDARVAKRTQYTRSLDSASDSLREPDASLGMTVGWPLYSLARSRLITSSDVMTPVSLL